jgi:hypothetical protein
MASAELPGRPQRQVDSPVSEVEQRAVSILERLAVFTVTFGPGAAVATYTTLFGWYQHEYQSKELLVWMRIALFAPFPLMKMLQQRYDTYFDEMYSTRTAYLFRIVMMQLIVATLMGVWMLLPWNAFDDMIPIVAFGVVLGACCAPFLGSSVQIAVAIDPVLLVWAQLGNTVGMTMPVLAEYVFAFSPGSTHGELCKVVAVPMILCILTSVWLGSLHYSEVFSDAYRVLHRRRLSNTPQPPPPVANPQDETAASSSDAMPEAKGNGDSDLEGSENASAASQELGAGLDDSFPQWVWLWLGMQATGIGLDFFLLALIGYFGDPHTTHYLASFTLLSAMVGRFSALPLRYLPAFREGPMHFSAAALFIARISFWSSLALKVVGVWQPSFAELITLWCLWNLSSMVHNSLTDMSVTTNVAEAKRQSVAQMGLTMSYSALFIGLAIASSLVLSLDDGRLDSLGGADVVA